MSCYTPREMSRSSLLLFTFATALLLPVEGSRAGKTQAPQREPLPEVDLPGQSDKEPVGDAFSLFPGPDSPPPEGITPGDGEVENPGIPPPRNSPEQQFPDLGPLGLPSDGEPMPELPVIPGLTLPPQPKPGVPGSNPSQGPTPYIAPGMPELRLGTQSHWHKSPFEARKVSIENHRPLLIFFAQRWDGDCPSLELSTDLFATQEFQDFAAANMVLTKLQYPVGITREREYGEAKMAALKRFQEYYKVKGFPCLILIDENGRELARVKGYRRIKDTSKKSYSTAHVVLEKLQETMQRYDERKRLHQDRINNLTSQGYRVWTSRAGSSMMGKLVEAKPNLIIIKDENGRWRQAAPAQLTLFDAEWARRKQAGLIPDRTEGVAAKATAMPLPPPPQELSGADARRAMRARPGTPVGKPAVP